MFGLKITFTLLKNSLKLYETFVNPILEYAAVRGMGWIDVQLRIPI